MKRINYFGLFLILMAMIVMSCDKDDNKQPDNCNVVNPVEELEWLKSSIKEIEQSKDESSRYIYYMTATYKGQTVFFSGSCHPSINYVSNLLNCRGESLGNTYNFYDKLSDVKLLWKHSESLCNFND